MQISPQFDDLLEWKILWFEIFFKKTCWDTLYVCFFGLVESSLALGVPQYDESHWPQSATVWRLKSCVRKRRRGGILAFGKADPPWRLRNNMTTLKQLQANFILSLYAASSSLLPKRHIDYGTSQKPRKLGTLQCLINVQNGKLRFIWLAKKDNLMLLYRAKDFSINMTAQHVNGMTHFDITPHGS